MTPLRLKFIEDMQLRGLADKTQTAYMHAVRDLAAHYRKSPEEITEPELREYFVFLTNEKQVSYSAFRVALCGIKLFYERTLQHQWAVFDLVRRHPHARPSCFAFPLKIKELMSLLILNRQQFALLGCCWRTIFV